MTQLIGLPVNDSDLSYLRACFEPKVIPQGDRDQFGARERLQALYSKLPEPKKLVFVPGADQLFTGRLGKASKAIEIWFAEKHPHC